MTSPRHLWILRADTPSVTVLSQLVGLPATVATISADRRRRGPYSAAGEVVRQVTPALLRTAPDVASRHDIELLAVAPELRATLPLRRATITAITAPRNRTRFYPGGRTTRLAHGLVEFLAEAVAARALPTCLVVTDVDDADGTDVEWLGILLRRIDPACCQVVVHSRGETLPEPLQGSLDRYAERRSLDGPVLPSAPVPGQRRDPAALAARHVAADGTSLDPDLAAAYEALDPAARAALHDARADELESLGERSLRLGAIPYHRERGSDPTGAGAAALLEAIEHCVLEGFYDAVVELAPRCLSVLDWETRVEDCWLVTAKATTALTALDRPEEAEAWYDAACAATTDPSVHLQSAYGRAMLYTRFFRGSRRNHHKAKAWVNTAIAVSSLLPDEQRRAFNLTFNENGLALVEMHLGDLGEALRLVETGIARLHEQVDPSEHTQHRSVLAYNRAQLLVALGRLDEGLAAYDEVIAEDPHHSEYYFERASVLRRLDRPHDALRDYDRAVESSPPYPEPHFNRADLAAALGDLDTALAELSYVLELEPTFVDAYVNRAALRLQAGDLEGAAADVAAGLRVQPDSAPLHCLDGLLAVELDESGSARAAFDRALGLDPTLAEALANRAVLRFSDGDVDGAIDDLTEALAADDDPGIRENRAVAYAEVGRLDEAVADCERALAHPDADRESLTALLQRCRAGLPLPA